MLKVMKTVSFPEKLDVKASYTVVTERKMLGLHR